MIGDAGMTDTLEFFHAPHSRSGAVRVLLEELGAPYTLNVVNMKAGEQLEPAYRAINPMGKVPAIRHGGAVVTEQVAIFIYLADRFPGAGLAPALDDPLRGPYLRWIAFYGSSFEPAAVDKALKREPGMRAMSPYGEFDTVIATLAGQMATGPWLLGERFTAADILWGTALRWMTSFGLVEKTPAIEAYLARFGERPLVQKADAADAALAAEQQPAAAGGSD